MLNSMLATTLAKDAAQFNVLYMFRSISPVYWLFGTAPGWASMPSPVRTRAR
jgi:hypothetical protein